MMSSGFVNDLIYLHSLHNQADSCRSKEMDITMIGLQNAGKTSLLRVLAVSIAPRHFFPRKEEELI
jgi:GTPase SAR1 family protein